MIINVKTGAPYEIYIERGILSRSGELIREISKAQKAIVVTDSKVDGLYSDTVLASLISCGFEADKFVFPEGEASKCHNTLIRLYDFLCEKNITRSDIIVALGGGVVGDLTGFAAATYLRGVPFVQIPTTLLAQIDSSVGGKTAVDLEGGKNLVGAFYQPKRVIIDPDVLSTLTDKIFGDGMAEAIKYGVIRDKKLFETIVNKGDIFDIIAECVKIKTDIVERDEFDTGERFVLNFGHTVGHAIEKLGNFTEYTHGQAVAAGMVIIIRNSEKAGLTEQGTTEKIIKALNVYSLPTDVPYGKEDLKEVMLRDKKRSANSITLVIAKNIGESYLHKIQIDDLEDFL